MKTLTLKQTQLADMQVNCMRAIEENHGDILTWFTDLAYPETLILQSVIIDDLDIKEANRLGFGVSLYSESCVNDNYRTIEAHFYSL